MKTTRRKKKGICLVLIMAMLAGAISMLGGATKAEAAEKKLMDTLDLNWDLKAGKEYVGTYNSRLNIIENDKGSVQIKNFTKETLKNGRKKVSFSVVRKIANQRLSDSEILNGQPKINEGCYFTVLDRATGLSMEKENDFGVKVKDSGWNPLGEYAVQYAANGLGWHYYKYSVTKVVITYPLRTRRHCHTSLST